MALGVDCADTINSRDWKGLDQWWAGSAVFVGRYFGPATTYHGWAAGERALSPAQKPHGPSYVVPFQATGAAVNNRQTVGGLQGYRNGQQDAGDTCDGIVGALSSGELRPSANSGVIRVYLDVEDFRPPAQGVAGLPLTTDYWNGWASFIYNHVHIYTDPVTGAQKPLQLWQPCIYCPVDNPAGPGPYLPDHGVVNALSPHAPANQPAGQWPQPRIAAPCYSLCFTRSVSHPNHANADFDLEAQTATEAQLQPVLAMFPHWVQPDADGHLFMNVFVRMWQYKTQIDAAYGLPANLGFDLDVTNEPPVNLPAQPINPTDLMLRMPA